MLRDSSISPSLNRPIALGLLATTVEAVYIWKSTTYVISSLLPSFWRISSGSRPFLSPRQKLLQFESNA